MARKAQAPTDRHYEQAIEMIADGNSRGAITELKSAIEADATDLAARVLLGNTYLEIDDPAAAVTEFLQARKDGANDNFVLAPLARAYVMLGRYEEALKELSKAGNNPSTAAEIAVIRGDAHLALQHYADAEKAYLEALKIRPQNSPTLNGLARVKIGTKALAEASNFVERALAARSDDPRALFAKGEIARLRGKEDEALADYARSVDAAPRYVPPRLARARIVIGRGNYKDAASDVLAVRELDAQNPYAAFLHALILASDGRVKEAQDTLAGTGSAAKAIPDRTARTDPSAMLLLGVHSYFHKDYADAYRHLTAYLKYDPQDVGAVKLLASLALSKGDLDYALHLLERLARRAPKDIEVLTMYGDALMRAKRHREAVVELEKAAALANSGYSALSRLVNLRLTAGQSPEARQMLKLEMARDPQAVKAALLLAATQLNQREYALSFETAALVIDHDSRNPVAHNLAGGALVGLGDVDGARNSFRAAFEAAPKYIPAVSNLAKLEFRLGNFAAAQRLYVYVVEQDGRNGAAMMALADIYLMRDDLDTALRWLERAREDSRTPELAALRLVELYIYGNETNKALSVARKLSARDPANLAFLTALGRARLAAKQVALAAVTFKEIAVRAAEKKSADWLVRNVPWQMRALDEQGARDSLDKALALDDKDVSAQAAYFNLEMAADKPEAALKRAAAVVALDKHSPLGHSLRGDAYMRMEKFESAVKAYGDALKESQGFAQAVRLYRAHLAAGKGAMEFAEGWAGERPKDADAQRLLAMAYGDARRDKEAVAVYETLLKAAPNDTVLLIGMAAQYQKYDTARALQAAEQAFRAAPAEPAVMDIYGWILVQQGRLDEGLTLLRKAMLQAPTEPAIRYHVAVALDRMGYRKEARHELSAALQAGALFEGSGAARQLMSKLDPSRQ